MSIQRFAAFLLFACALNATPSAQSATADKKPGADELELIKTCRARLAALNHFDVGTLDRLTHNEYIGTGDDGVRLSKAGLLKSYAPHSAEPPNSYGAMDDVQARIFGLVGILNYRVELRERFGDRDIVTALRRTDVFLKEDGRWQEISAQLTAIPVNRLTPVAADPAHYDEYVGDYEITAGKMDHVTHEGQTLMSESMQSKAELLPLGNETFFLRQALGQITFTRDPDGHVNGYTFRRADGQEILARKIK